MELVHRTIVNAGYGFLSSIWPLIFSLLITPIVVSSLGYKEYGIYVFISTVLSMIGLIDFGISTAVKKYLAEYHARQEMERIKSLIGTSNVIFLIIGIIGMLIIFVGLIAPSLIPIFKSYSIYQIGIAAAGIMFLVNAISSVSNIVPPALQRFDISFKIGFITLTIQQLSILVLVINGYSINAIFVTQLIISILSLFIQFYFANRLLPNLIFLFGWDSKEAKKSYTFGAVTFFNNLATTSLTYLDRLIIPFFLGPSSLSFYSLPGNISNRIPGISNSLASILFPMASSYSGTGDIDILRKLYVRSFRLITVLAIAISIVTISYSKELLTYWISPEMAEKATTVLIILAVTNMFLALIGPLSQFLLGLGKLKFLTTLSIVMAVFNTLLLVILVPAFGINGAAWAYLISLIPAIYMFYFTEKHYLNLGDRLKYYISIILKNLIVSSIIWAISFIFLRQFATNLWLVILLGGISGLLYLTLYWLFGFFEKEDVEALKRTLLRIISRFHK